MVLGWIFASIAMMMSSGCFVQLSTGCDHLIQDQSVSSLLCIIPISVHVGNNVLLILSSSASCHLQIFSSNHHLTYCPMQCGWIPTFVAPSLCQIHRHYSVSGIDDYFARC